MGHTFRQRIIRTSAAALAVPALLLLSACGSSGGEIGDEVRISDGTMTVTAIEERTADDLGDLELDELAGQTPYFVSYEVVFNDGKSDLNENFWKAKASNGEASPINVLDFGGDFDCTGLGEVSDGKAEGCQLIMVPEGATLESVSFGGAGTWRAPKAE